MGQIALQIFNHSVTGFSLPTAIKQRWADWQTKRQHRALSRRIADEIALFDINDLLDMGYGRDDIPALAREAARLHLRTTA